MAQPAGEQSRAVEIGMKRKRLPSFSSLEAKLDKVFSLWVRTKDADANGMVTCVTCQVVKHYKTVNAGHFWKRQHRATRWVKENCHVQCVRCNKYLNGNESEHAAYILRTYGQKTFDWLEQLHRQTVKFTRADLESMIAKFQGET